MMEKIDKGHPLSQSTDFVAQNIETLKTLFPTIVKEGKIDLKELQALLGDEVETEEEYYRFTWAGKSMARREANKPSTATIRPDKASSKDWDTTQNIFIEGDNLEVLKLLQKSYANKINMIYIDPPYNTGKDFIYKDNYNDNLGNYLAITGQVDDEGRRMNSNSESDGRFHSHWLSMMYPRLKLARNLLTNDGAIFISIDDNELINLTKVCNELFGEENFIANLIWQKKTGASDSKNISIITEYILIFAKNVNCENEIFNRNKESFDLGRYRLSDKYEEKRGKYYIDNLDRGGLSYSDSLNYPIECPDGSLTFPNGRTEYKNDGWIWKWGKDKLKWGIENDFIEFRKSESKESGWAVCYKNYLNVNNEDLPIERSAPMKNLIQNILNANASSDLKKIFDFSSFDYPKPIDLLKTIISYKATCENMIILDFFAGSGTTAHAVMQLNSNDSIGRKFICVQLPEKIDETHESYREGFKSISEITKERIRRAGENILSAKHSLLNGKLAELNELEEEITLLKNQGAIDKIQLEISELRTSLNKLDIGFKAFKLDSSNIRTWDGNPEALEDNLFNAGSNIKENRTEEDVLYEILIKYGLDLTIPIEQKEIVGKQVFNIGMGTLFCCLAENITTAVAEGIGKWKEEQQPATSKVIFKDTGFTDVEKTNSIQILKRYGILEVNTI